MISYYMPKVIFLITVRSFTLVKQRQALLAPSPLKPFIFYGSSLRFCLSLRLLFSNLGCTQRPGTPHHVALPLPFLLP